MSQIRADNITNRQGTGAPIFVNGIRVVGLTSIANIVANTGTFSGAVSIGGTLTYEDVTNVDSIGIVTARSGVDITGASAGVNGSSNLILKTGGNEKARIDSSGRMGLGTNNPTKKLTVQAGGDNTDIALFAGNDLNRGLLISTIAANSQNDMGVVYHAHGQHGGSYLGEHIFKTNNTERLRITTTGMQVTGNQVSNIVAMGANSVDCSLGNSFTKTITGATTFTFDNVSSGVEYSFTLQVTLNGSNAITWPTTVKWNADTAPTITDGKTQLFMFLTTNGGTRWRGSALVDYVN